MYKPQKNPAAVKIVPGIRLSGKTNNNIDFTILKKIGIILCQNFIIGYFLYIMR